MNFFKELGLGLLSFLLFLSLSIFGFAFMLNQTILNSKFIAAELDRLDVSTLTEEIITEHVPEEDLPDELRPALLNAINRIEPLVKEQLGSATSSIYGYLKGKNDSPDLKGVLGNTFFNSDFVVSLMDELDVPLLADEIISEQAGGEGFTPEFRTALVNTIAILEPSIREEIGAASDPIFDYLLGNSQNLDLAFILRNTVLDTEFAVTLINELDISSLTLAYVEQQLAGKIPALNMYLDYAINEIEPEIKQELIAAANPLLDYLLGIRHNINVSISLEQVKDSLRQSFLESPLLELAGLPQSELETYFNQYFNELSEYMPSVFKLDETILGTDIPIQFAEAIATTEDSLTQARQDIDEAVTDMEEALAQARVYVGYFQLGYYLLIGFIVLLILGIILISRDVRDITRRLGIPLIVYGALELAAVIVGRYFINKYCTEEWLTPTDIPQTLQTWLLQFSNNVVAPLQWFSLGLLIVGIILTIVSFVYKRQEA